MGRNSLIVNSPIRLCDCFVDRPLEEDESALFYLSSNNRKYDSYSNAFSIKNIWHEGRCNDVYDIEKCSMSEDEYFHDFKRYTCM
jgi:hypothetical protein